MKKFVAVIWILISGAMFPQWVNESGPGSEFIFEVQEFENKIYAVADSVLFVKENSVWNQISIHGFEPQTLTSVFVEGSVILVGTSNNGAFISRNSGETWSHFLNGFPGNAIAINSFLKVNEYLYAATDGEGVYRSLLSQLSSWEAFNNGLSLGISFNVSGIYHDGQRLYISAGGNGYIFYRDVNDQAWIPRFVADLTADASVFPEIISDSGLLYAAGSPGLYMSTDQGDTWVRVEGVAGSYNPILIESPNGIYYAALRATTTASFYLVNGNQTPPLQLFPVPQFAVVNGIYYSGRLYIPTAAGLYSRELPLTSAEPITYPAEFSLSSVYPNPFNSSGILLIKARAEGEYSIDIIGLSGEIISSSKLSLMAWEQSSYRIAGENLPTGSYFVRVRNKQGVKVQKFVVLK